MCGAEAHERSPGRVNHLNGSIGWQGISCPRSARIDGKPVVGAVDIQIPKLRNVPEFREPHRASETAMTAVIQDA